MTSRFFILYAGQLRWEARTEVVSGRIPSEVGFLALLLGSRSTC
ncbi:hypothetical protein ACLB1R_29560 [Escherichia coli]